MPNPTILPVDICWSRCSIFFPSAHWSIFKQSCSQTHLIHVWSRLEPHCVQHFTGSAQALLHSPAPILEWRFTSAPCCKDANTRSSTARCSQACSSSVFAGKWPVPGGNCFGGGLPSTSARKFSRYQAAASVLYFTRMGMLCGTPCLLMKSLNRWFPPNSIIRSCVGCQLSIVVERTKLCLTPRLRCTPAASILTKIPCGTDAHRGAEEPPSQHFLFIATCC